MKKKLLLLTFAVIGIITAIALTQLNNTCYDEILNANVEALAWNGSEGGADVVKCVKGGPTCYHNLILCDEHGNPLKDPEGNPISFTERIDGMKNVQPEAQ